MSKSTKNTAKKSKNEKVNNEISLELSQPFLSSKKLFWIIGMIAFLIFANSISNGYNLDDELVTQNHQLTSRGIEAIGAIFTSPYYSDEMGYAYGYRPIVHLSFAIEHQFFGEKASVSHFFNVLLFALSSMLFFKFLLKLLGEKQLLFSVLTTLIFVVHPIHTEVVDSIKNRDEILAFLFVILSGISILNYSKHNKLISLILILLFFTIAMLSKKSVYPMVVVLPFIIVLIHDISLKKLLLISSLLILPAAPIAGELDLLKTLFFILLPWLGIIPIFYIKTKLIYMSGFSWVKFFKLPFLPFSLLILVAFATIYFNQFYGSFFAILLGVWAILSSPKIGVLLLTIISMVFDYKFNTNHFSLSLIFVSTSVFMGVFFKSKKVGFELISPILAIIYFLVFNHSIFQIGTVIAILIFCFLVEWKVIYGLILALVILIISAIFFHVIGFLPFAFLTVSLSNILNKFWPKINIYASQLLFLVGILILHFTISNQSLQTVNQTEKSLNLKEFSKNYANLQVQNSITKEGRFLEYIENTLVAPHSTAQTIGTGAQTLGEYLKLMVFPCELSFYYGYAKTSTVGLKNPWVWLSILSHLLLLFLAFWQIKKRPLITIGIAWYFLSILLFSNWIELVAGMVGERLAFSASAGFSIFLVAVLFWIKPTLNFKKPSWLEVAIGLIFILFITKTVSRNNQWQNHITLMENDLSHLENSAQANNLYASNLIKYAASDATLSDLERFDFQKLAVQHFKKSVKIYPYFFNTQFDKARASISIGDTVSAIHGYQKAIELDSTYSDTYFFLLNIFKLQKDQKAYLKTARLLGHNFQSFSSKSERLKAINLLKDTNIVVASFQKEKIVAKSIESNPLDAESYFDLLNVYAQQNDGQAYLNTAKKLAKIYNKSDLYEALAKGYFMTNQIDSAILILNQGIALHPNVQSLKDNLQEVEKFR